MSKSQALQERIAAEAGDAAAQFDVSMRKDRRFLALFKLLFDQEKRLRALEGGSGPTKAQFKASLKALFTE